MSRSATPHSSSSPGIDRLGPLGRRVIAMSRHLRAARQLAVPRSHGGKRRGDGDLGRTRRAG